MIIQKLIQPNNSSLCGQTIVAMLGNISIPKAIEIVGKKGGTYTKDIIQALGKLGFETCSNKLIRIPKNWVKPALCIVKIRLNGTWRSHWTLWNGQEGCFYDPAFEPEVPEGHYVRRKEARMTSYLEIRRGRDGQILLQGF